MCNGGRTIDAIFRKKIMIDNVTYLHRLLYMHNVLRKFKCMVNFTCVLICKGVGGGQEIDFDKWR